MKFFITPFLSRKVYRGHVFHMTTGIIELTPTQAVSIYGYLKPLRILNWKTVADREDLTFKKLYKLGLTERQLSHLQSNKHLWVRDKGLKLEDITLVPSWKLHVTRDMHATLPEIAMMNLTFEYLQHSGVTFQDLVDAGLTVNLMPILRLNLMSWVQLGLHMDFLKDITDAQSIAQFNIPTHLVLQCVHEQGGAHKPRFDPTWL